MRHERNLQFLEEVYQMESAFPRYRCTSAHSSRRLLTRRPKTCSLFALTTRWMTERFEKRLPNTSYGVHDAETAAQAGGMTLEELERCFYQAIVDDYQQDWDGL